MADPSGKQGRVQFIKVNSGSAQSFSAAALSGGNIVLTTSGTPIAYGNTVTVSYTAGTVTAADGGVLASFSGQAVTNNIPAGAPTDTFLGSYPNPSEYGKPVIFIAVVFPSSVAIHQQ